MSFILLSFTSTIFPQFGSVRFENLTISNGLSNNSINSIIQTSDGFLWIATKDGLNRFDGQNFKVFKHNSQKNSLPENYVMSLLESEDKTFWIGTWGAGLYKYNQVYETFTKFDLESPEDDFIQFIFEDHSNYIWYGTTNGGINKLNPRTKEIISYSPNKSADYFFPDIEITSITEDKNHYIWVGTLNNGLVRLDPSTHKIKVFKHNLNSSNSISSNFILTIYNESNDYLLLGTESGIDKFDLTTYSISHNPGAPQNLNAQLNVSIKHIIKDLSGKFWAGTYDYLGLYSFKITDNKLSEISHYLVNEKDPNSLISNRVRWLYVDKKNNLWIGTEEGISKLPAYKAFVQFNYKPEEKIKLGGKVVSSIIEGGEDILWIGYGGSGFDRLNLKTGEIIHHKNIPGKSNSLSNDDVVSLYLDRKGILWISTSTGGLNSYDPKNKIYKRYLRDPENIYSIKSNWVQQVLETNESKFLVGTNNGLQEFDRVTERFYEFKPSLKNNSTSIPSNAQVNALFQDSRENIWVGTWLDGLYKYDPKNKMIYHYLPEQKNQNSLSSSKITSINEDSKGNIWICTHAGGLNKFDSASNKFFRFDIRKGLPNDVVFGIHEDKNGFLWISTLNGLAKFDPLKETFRIYDQSDGLINNTFNWRASLKSKSGKIYFGGLFGFVQFDPGLIPVDSIIAPIAFTSFKLFDKEATLPQSLPATREIVLNYNQNFFSIEFATLDMQPFSKHKYKYMLVGIDKDWIEAESRTIAYYTDIDYGEYRFLVKSGNADNIWSEPIALSIIINPAWWMTWWFKSIILLLALIAMFIVYKIRVKQLLKIERLRFNIASDLHDEIGSNLSSICVDGQLLLKSTTLKENERELSNDISKTASQTLEAMRDIVWFINPKNDDGEDIIFKMRETAAKLLAGIDWSFNTTNGIKIDLFSLEQRRNIFLIYKEALTNVFRHSNANQCSIDITVNAGQMDLVVKDNGTGFDFESVKKNTGLISMLNRAEKINGKLKIDSARGKGTTVQLTIKMNSYKG